MANVTSRAVTGKVAWGDDKVERGLAATAAVYHPAGLIALDGSGNAVKCDDTAGLRFDGINAESVRVEVFSGDSAGDRKVRVQKPWMITIKIAAAVATDVGRKVYALYDDEVAFSTVNSILVGTVEKVINATTIVVRPYWTSSAAGVNPFDGETLTFTGATGVNIVDIPDNLADALSVKEGSNAYLTFVTTNSSERVKLGKSTVFPDSISILIGTGEDADLRWDGTDLDLLAAANNSVFKVGNGTNSWDLWLYGSAAGNYLLWDASANSLTAVGVATIRTLTAIADPGNAGAIPVTHSGYVPLVTGGAETRTIAAPTFIGQELLLYLKTDGGNCVVTVATTLNETGDNTITFANTGESVRMIAVEEGSNLRWRCPVADPTTILSTV